MRKKLFWTLCFFLFLGAGVLLFSKGLPDGGDNQAQKGVVKSAFVAIAKGRIDVEGGIVQLAASRDGIIKDVLVEEGEDVRKDQVLAVQDSRQARLSYELCSAELEQSLAAIKPLRVRLEAAMREKKRHDPLIEKQVVSKQKWDSLKDAVGQLEAEISVCEAAAKTAESRRKVAEYEMEQRVIRAPAAGKIIKRMAKPGDGVSTLNVTPLFWFVPSTPRIVKAELDEHFVASVKPGMPADIVPENDEDSCHKGRIIRMGGVFGPKRPSIDDPQERADVRVVECVLSVDRQDMIIGQRVLVKIKNSDCPSGQ